MAPSPVVSTTSEIFESDLLRLTNTFTDLLATTFLTVPVVTAGNEEIAVGAMQGFIDYATPIHKEFLTALEDYRTITKSWKDFIACARQASRRSKLQQMYDRRQYPHKAASSRRENATARSTASRRENADEQMYTHRAKSSRTNYRRWSCPSTRNCSSTLHLSRPRDETTKVRRGNNRVLPVVGILSELGGQSRRDG